MQVRAQIVVRKLDGETKARLQQRAKLHGRSVEEEVREILREPTRTEATPPRKLGDEMKALFGKVGLEPDEEIQELRGIRLRAPDFSE